MDAHTQAILDAAAALESKTSEALNLYPDNDWNKRMKGKRYCIGLYADYERGPNSEGRTVTIQLREDMDSMSCELIAYLGRFIVTKAELKKRLRDKAQYKALLETMNGCRCSWYTPFTRIEVD